MMILTSTRGRPTCRAIFRSVFDVGQRHEQRTAGFRAARWPPVPRRGPHPGPVAELEIHNDDIFARLIREGDLGFCEAYLEGWWTTPDLQAFMDLVHADNDELYDGFPGMGLVRAYRKAAVLAAVEHQAAGAARTSITTMIWATISTGCGWTTR